MSIVLCPQSLEKEMKRLSVASKAVSCRLPGEEPRLEHMVLFLLCSGADQEVIKVVLTEQLSLCEMVDTVSQ